MADVVPPPSLAAILAAADRSRWPVYWQAGQASTRPAGLGIRNRQAGQVEEVPRSSTKVRLIPAAWALSLPIYFQSGPLAHLHGPLSESAQSPATAD
jgi:hypothetical protein